MQDPTFREKEKKRLQEYYLKRKNDEAVVKNKHPVFRRQWGEKKKEKKRGEMGCPPIPPHALIGPE